MDSLRPALLRAAVCSSESEALAAWRSVRKSIDVEALSWDVVQIIPTLHGRLDGWLRDDPAESILAGIVRRAWTEAQLRLRIARGILDRLETGVLLGSAAVSLRNRFAGSVRPISDLRILVPRDHLPRAASVLAEDGWQAAAEIPSGDALNWCSWISFSRDPLQLYLFWRALPVTGPRAARCEREFFAHAQANLLAPEHAFLAAICGRMNPDPDVVPWQIDAALLPVHPLDWKMFSAAACDFAREAFARVQELRALGLAIPKVRRPLRFFL